MKRFFYSAGLLLFAMTILVVSRAVQQTSAPGAPIGTPEQEEFFRVSADVIDRGDQITLGWRVPGVDHLAIDQRYGYYKTAAQALYDNLPAEGSLVVDLMRRDVEQEVGIPYIHNVEFTLYVPSETSTPFVPPGYAYKTSISIRIRCPYTSTFFGELSEDDLCPLTEPQTIEAVYQPFEQGFMLWRSDTNLVYAFLRVRQVEPITSGMAARVGKGDATAQTSSGVSPRPVSAFAMDDRFAPYLTHGLVMSLGAPTTAAVTYQAVVQDSYGPESINLQVMSITLPDTHIIGYREMMYGTSWSCLSCGGAAPPRSIACQGMRRAQEDMRLASPPRLGVLDHAERPPDLLEDR